MCISRRQGRSWTCVLNWHVNVCAVPNFLKCLLDDRGKTAAVHAAQKGERIGSFAREGELAVLE